MDITAGFLKNLAVFLMLLNHAGDCVLTRIMGIDSGFLYNFIWHATRASFVIFAFQIAEGMIKTHDRKAYIKRLGLLAIISEIPYDLYFYREWFNPCSNIFFTLFIGALGIHLIDAYTQNKAKQILTAVLCFIAASAVQSVYSFYGVMIIFAFYYLRDSKSKMFITVAFLLSFGYIADIDLLKNFSKNAAGILKNAMMGLHGALAFPLIALYKGNKGKMLNKWFYYFFYPAHLLILYFIMRFAL